MHLRDYIETEEKYGHSAKEYKEKKIAVAEETLKILGHIKDPENYYRRRRKTVEAKYPKYKYLITRYADGSTSLNGDFVAYGNGWVGRESEKDPREGYFEFVAGRFVQAESPCKTDTDRLLAELDAYHAELNHAYKRAESDSDRDFERLGMLLLKENLFSWWD